MSQYSAHNDKTPAAATYVSLSDAKNYLKVSYNTDDSLITSMIKAAEDQVEGMTNRAVNTHDCVLNVEDTYNYDDSTHCDIRLMIGARTSLVVYRIEKDEETELTLNTDYYLKGKNQVRIVNCPDDSQFKITYTIAAENLPLGMDTAILKLVADYYENRSNDSIVPVMRVSETTKSMIVQYADPLIYV